MAGSNRTVESAHRFTDTCMYEYPTVVSEYLALQVVGPKDMKKQKVVGPAKMVSAITRLGKVRLT